MTWSATLQARVGAFEVDVTLAGEAGVLALVGPNGSGKTTILRLLLGALTPTRVEFAVASGVVASTTRGICVPIEQRKFGYVPQGAGLFPHLSVLDNVAFGLSTGRNQRPPSQRHRLAARMLDEVGCKELATRRPSRLSGGERQRVALARALLLEPDLLLLDEPMSALDASTRRSVRALLAERLPALGRPCILVTHDVRDVDALEADVVVVEQGRVTQRGTLAQLRASPGTPFVAEFVG